MGALSTLTKKRSILMSKELQKSWTTIFLHIENDYQRTYHINKVLKDLTWKIDNNKYLADLKAEYLDEREKCKTTNTISTAFERLDGRLADAIDTQKQVIEIRDSLRAVMKTLNIEEYPQRHLSDFTPRVVEGDIKTDEPASSQPTQ